jgi:hypothetical protein
MSAQLPDEEPEVEGTPDTVPTKTPDAELELTDDGIEMPEFLRGYVGDITMRTPNVTGEFETSELGMPDEEVADVIFAEMPEEGDYHGDLEAGMMALSTDDTPETVFEIIDNRSEEQ